MAGSTLGGLANLTPQGALGNVAAQALGGSSASGIKGPVTTTSGPITLGALNFGGGNAGTYGPLLIAGVAILALVLLLRK